MDRRNFLTALAAAAAAGLRAWPTASFSFAASLSAALSTDQLQGQALEDLRSFGAFRLVYTSTHSDPTKSHLVVVNTGTPEVEMAVPITLEKRHSIVLGPGENPEFALVPELDGNKAVLVSLHARKVVAEIKPALKDHYFSGHGCFSLDGKTVYLPEHPISDGSSKGMLIARSVPSLKVQRKLSTGQYRPHNLLLSRDGNTMMIGHYGFTPGPGMAPIHGGMARLELATGKLLPTSNPANPNYTLCHLEKDDEENVMVSARTWMGKDNHRPAPILFGTMKGEKWEGEMPEEFKSRFLFNFSLRLAKKAGILAVVHKEGSLVTFWNAREKKFLSALDLPGEMPMGMAVTPDERYFLVNTTGGALLYIDVKTRLIAKRSFMIGLGYCPHIALLAVPGGRTSQKQL